MLWSQDKHSAVFPEKQNLGSLYMFITKFMDEQVGHSM